ncbi:MAG: flavin reductase family protein [Burkholderiales bacterium]|nr:flavin reductase family protein [Burkholderiales bacterium]
MPDTPVAQPDAPTRPTPPSSQESAAVHDAPDYRKALSCFATGVTVVTTHWAGQDWGITCNSLDSVSLEPRLVLWSIRRASHSLQAFTQAGNFTISVLAESQQALARQFATGSMTERFAGAPVLRQPGGGLRLDGCAAWFDCQLHQLIEAGDHSILLGEVTDFGWDDTPALAFWHSRFGQILSQTPHASTSAAPAQGQPVAGPGAHGTPTADR